ncbi:RNA-binding RNA annealing protein [Lithohypha guttulata]|uniref:RNA-binding RNA annealing protein n=1 Tax=Lithohypha guttulata TaxID=1690604 RepID=A0AAN7T182_9EURO|nr:RNA-binding RNA annealing protein [Lithohypha guttulata]KAK5103506.1 RNA-binding RNA annealing protein [Lithohypha guttulata]
MSARIDQSLDSIIDGQKKAKRSGRRNQPRKAPVGGVKKAVKPMKPAVKPATGPAHKGPRNSKILVSRLPHDVNETQIKEYFGKSVGPIKKVSVHYNELGVEVVFDASNVPAAPSLAERVAYANPKPGKSDPLTKTSANSKAHPKAQPKSVTAKKVDNKNKKVVGKDKPAKKAKNARPKPKTAEELDAEMTDYWNGSNAAATTEGAATSAAATAGDAMEEIS